MNLAEALKALSEGHAVRQAHWPPGQFLILRIDGIFDEQGDQCHAPSRPGEYELLPKEEVKSKKVWQWRYRGGGSEYWVLCPMLLTKEEADKWFRNQTGQFNPEIHAGPFEVSL